MRQTPNLLLIALLEFFLCQLTFSPAQAGPNPQIIEAAKSEGNVSYYTTMTLSQSKKVVDKFQKKYPFIMAELFRGGGDEVLNRILNEARGGLYAWDVVSTRGDSVLTLKDSKLITSYRSPESKFISPDLGDDEGYWTAYYVNPYVLGYNTNLVKKSDVPKTYEELLDPW
jgi:iron(III) transport system substrate-binding protein